MIYKTLPFLFFVAVVFGFNPPYVALLTLIAAGVHEIGHEAILLIIGKKTVLPEGKLNGFRIRMPHLTYRGELLLYAGGPVMSFIVFFLSYILSLRLGEYFRTFAVLNLMTGISNLALIRGYDGYGIVSSIFNMCSLGDRWSYALRWCSIISLVFAVMFSLYLMYVSGEGFWVYCVFVCAMFRELEEVRGAIFENSGEKRRKNEENEVFSKFFGG